MMMTDVSSEAEHPWDDLGIPVAMIVERPREIHVIYRRSGNGWRATSPDIRRMNDYGDALKSLALGIRERLARRYPADVRIIHKVDTAQQPSTIHPSLINVRGAGPLSPSA
ncbi:hypothetical protein ACFHYQ_04385 [Sphaerimonospora cavernae]|uniref:Uncharacterized protein n=1 Tax=Sphaerimonospora cavernae TaxID=1740611 RepID=A0ABV6U300_9ACTN